MGARRGIDDASVDVCGKLHATGGDVDATGEKRDAASETLCCCVDYDKLTRSSHREIWTTTWRVETREMP